MKQIIFLTIYFLFLSCKTENVLVNESMNVSISPRIVGGQDANFILHSHTLALRYLGNIFCTAFAVNKEDVLSAGHCFNGMEPPYEEVTVHSRSANRNDLGTIHKIQHLTIHPGYDRRKGLLHDIAHILLKEGSEIDFNEYQLKADLPTQDVSTGADGIMLGWGCTVPNGLVVAEKLQMLEMRILNYKDCEARLTGEHKTKLRRYQLCAVGGAGHGCATGDSGGPLVIGNVAVGIHSSCLKGQCAAGLPELFTNIFYEKDFLKTVLREYPTEWSSPSLSPSLSPSTSPESDNRSKKLRRNSANRMIGKWFRKVTCTAK